MKARRGNGVLAGALLVLLGPGLAVAHPLAPSLLDLREEAPGRIAVLWMSLC